MKKQLAVVVAEEVDVMFENCSDIVPGHIMSKVHMDLLCSEPKLKHHRRYTHDVAGKRGKLEQAA